jgi:tetratricopeptide (TPR) repeat protein
LAFWAVANVAATAADLAQARELYNRTQYEAALREAEAIRPRTAAAQELVGQIRFMLGDFKKAVEAFEAAVKMEPDNSEYAHWLGRAWGRRAETANPLMAPGYAAKTRQWFERAVALNPRNQEALNDLFDYYLEAPGFLGGGIEKAAKLAEHIAMLDTAEGYWAKAQVADRRKEFDRAEDSLRRAMNLAPQQVGRVIDLARYLAKRGRTSESDAVFLQAQKMAPNSPKVLYARAEVLVKEKRNLDEARNLLRQYLHSPLTPEDPPREQAERLLKQAGS